MRVFEVLAVLQELPEHLLDLPVCLDLSGDGDLADIEDVDVAYSTVVLRVDPAAVAGCVCGEF